MCHIFIFYDYVKDDNTAKAKGYINTGRLNSVRPFSLPLGLFKAEVLSALPLEPTLRCIQKKSAGSWQIVSTLWCLMDPKYLATKDDKSSFGYGGTACCDTDVRNNGLMKSNMRFGVLATTTF